MLFSILKNLLLTRRPVNKHALSGCLSLVFLFFIASCQSPSLSRAISSTPFFLAPTSIPQQTATFTPLPATPAGPVTATPTAVCLDNLRFISDITIPDETVVASEATLDKRWEVENSGNCNWSENYRVRLIAGPDLGAQTEQALFPARSGTRAVIRIVFKAPTEAGSYRSAWQAFSPQGEPFGDPFFIIISVQPPDD